MTNISNSNKKQIYTFGKENFSKYEPIDVKPVFGRNWITNGVNNSFFKVYRDAYNDSCTNSSIINAYVSYMFGEGLIDEKNNEILDKYISQEDVQKCLLDLKKFGGFSLQVVWNLDKKPFRLKYIPIYKLAIEYNQKEKEVTGYWYSFDWNNKARYKPELYRKYNGTFKEGLDVLYIRRPTDEPFFPIPDYFSGLRWARVEGEISNGGLNFYENTLSELTVINYNGGTFEDEKEAEKEADRVRSTVSGSSNNGKVVVSFNRGVENSVTVDRVAPSEMSQHNVFYSEEAERKLIIAHSAPPILFSGSSQTGFSSNADERAIAIKDLYRRNINPLRMIFLNGLYDVFQQINPIVKLGFKDFEEENELDKNTENGENTPT